jgi:YjbE family integral membrane protein
MDFLSELNWLAVGQIVLIDILLGGDNAIVIALACRNLAPELRRRGIAWGTVGAIALRVALIVFAVGLLKIPFLKLVGGVLLLWIGIQLFAENEPGHDIQASDKLLTAIRTIIVADAVMSIDNVVAIASAAENAGGRYQILLIVFGILVSIPIIVWGSTLVMRLMERFPVIVTLGAALLGYLGGAMIVSDVALAPWFDKYLPYQALSIPGLNMQASLIGLCGAVAVVLIGHRVASK